MYRRDISLRYRDSPDTKFLTEVNDMFWGMCKCPLLDTKYDIIGLFQASTEMGCLKLVTGNSITHFSYRLL